MKKISVIICLLIHTAIIYSQNEVEEDLQMNPVLIQHALDFPAFKMASANDTVNLPFKDDFSYASVYPDTSLWTDNYVFINRTYPVAPPSIGVATFDGLNANGYPYNFSAGANSSAEADKLTSKFIRLGSPLTPADSVYLSFYYQATGRGNDPETLDSLILQFYTITGGWTNVWGRRGYSPSSIDTGFHLVMVPITALSYFTNTFRFRFVNHATLSGNLDHWHVDYVYLNSARTKNDTIFNDVAFVYNPTTFLKNYQQMPWEQYTTGERADSLSIFIRNNSSSAMSVIYKDTLFDNTFAPVWNYDGGSCNVNPFVSSGYAGCISHKRPAINYNFSAMSDTISYTAEHLISASGDSHAQNNYVSFKQQFYNYYAIDDGTTESGYGLTANNSTFAYKITLNAPDTLRAFQLFFNPIQTSVVSYPMRFAVWSNSSGYPGALIKKDSIIYPSYSTSINEFITYNFDTVNPLVLSPGTYFFGWIQHTSNVLNVGLDKNTSSTGKAFYNIGTGWQLSSIQGSVMLRPVFGKKLVPNGINNTNSIESSFTIYPNPASGLININGGIKSTTFIVYDSFGRMIQKNKFNTNCQLDISYYANGIYILVFENENGGVHTQKLIVNNQH